MRLKPVGEQVVVLMGASSGIGRETALRFAERGAKVVVSARSEEGLNSLVDEIRSKGGQATAVPAEVTEFEQVKAVTDRAVEEYGRLDTWVHLAAVLLVASFEKTAPEEFARQGVYQVGRQAGCPAADLPAGHRLRSHTPRRREPYPRSGRRRCGQGANTEPDCLAAAA